VKYDQMSDVQSFQHNFTIYYVTSNRSSIGWMQSWNNIIICSVQNKYKLAMGSILFKLLDQFITT